MQFPLWKKSKHLSLKGFVGWGNLQRSVTQLIGLQFLNISDYGPPQTHPQIFSRQSRKTNYSLMVPVAFYPLALIVVQPTV